VVIGPDGKSLRGDEVELVGTVVETIVIGHQRIATVSTNGVLYVTLKICL
jgi:hypothetical protein